MAVRRVGMAVPQRQMAVPMAVCLARIDAIVVDMALRRIVMRVVAVAMLVFQRLVQMLVRVPLAQVQPHTHCHEHAGGGELDRHGLAEQRHRHQRADERRHREVGAGASGPEMAERQNEQDEADADDRRRPDEAADASRRESPTSGSTGPITPPLNTAASSHGSSRRDSRAWARAAMPRLARSTTSGPTPAPP